MRKWVYLLVVLILVFLGYNYLYKSHRNIEKESAAYVISAASITNEFEESPSESEKKYLNKTIEIYGVVTELGIDELILDHVVFCQFANLMSQDLKLKESLSVKGRCIGYDDLLEQVKLDQCILVEVE